MDFNSKDDYLQERFDKNIFLISEGRIPSSSRIIPINESLTSLQWVLPTNQVIEILRNARSFALQNCSCRVRYQRCDKPLDVCFLINDAADKAVRKGEANYIEIEEALEKLKLANQYGLVHLTLYNPEQHVFALCSCCDCCCHDLQIMKKYQRPHFIAHSDYIAEVDNSKCLNCGKCVQRCVFGAQVKNATEDTIEYHPEYCYGCGLCLTTCPTDSIKLIYRK